MCTSQSNTGLAGKLVFDREQEDSEMNNFYKEGGQGLVEYALIMLLVAMAVIVILALLGPYIGNLYSSVIQNL
jgi:pilus assembly protein Flp/PilA